MRARRTRAPARTRRPSAGRTSGSLRSRPPGFHEDDQPLGALARLDERGQADPAGEGTTAPVPLRRRPGAPPPCRRARAGGASAAAPPGGRCRGSGSAARAPRRRAGPRARARASFHAMHAQLAVEHDDARLAGWRGSTRGSVRLGSARPCAGWSSSLIVSSSSLVDWSSSFIVSSSSFVDWSSSFVVSSSSFVDCSSSFVVSSSSTVDCSSS